MLLNVRPGFAVLERKLYRLVIARLDGDRVSDNSYCDYILELTRKGIGGFMLVGGTKGEVKPLLAKAQSLAEKLLLIASFAERGVGSHMKDATLFPGPMAFAAALGVNGSRNLPLITRALTAMAVEAADCGINMPLIPTSQPDFFHALPETGDMAPSSSGHIMEWLASTYAGAFRDIGLSPWREHVSSSGESWFRPALPETKAGPGPDINARMIDTKDGAAACVAAGADLLLGSDDPDATVKELIRDLPAHGITEDRIDAMLEKIEEARPRLDAGGTPDAPPVDYPGNEELAQEVAQRAVTLVRGHGRFLPVRDSDSLPLIYSGDREYFLTSPLRFFVKQASHEKKPLSTHERPVVFLLFGKDVDGKNPGDGEKGATEVAERLIRDISPSIVVSFGSPLLLSRFKKADVLIAAYDSSPQAQEAVFNCIIGERYFEGWLPVDLTVPTKGGPERP